MKILISVSAEPVSTVLRKMVATINADVPGHATAGTYTNVSCFGRVAHYLRTNWNDSWKILMFGFDGVEHCCLYTEDGKKLVDTFNGVPKADGYYNRRGECYPNLASIRLSDLSNKVSRLQ